jgi:excisionase family DNA binding protein
MTTSQKIMSVTEVSKICGVTRATIWRWIKAGQLKAATTAGGHHRILPSDLQSFMEKKKMPVRFRGRNKKRILIVDDDDSIRKFFSRILDREDMELAYAADGFDAGLKTVQFEPDLVILDLFMPEMNGFAVCQKIKENNDTANIKIIAISGYDTKENVERIFQCGANDFCPKPLNKQTIIKAIDNLIK